MVNDIVEEMKFNGLDADHKVVSLGRKTYYHVKVAGYVQKANHVLLRMILKR